MGEGGGLVFTGSSPRCGNLIKELILAEPDNTASVPGDGRKPNQQNTSAAVLSEIDIGSIYSRS